MTLKYDAKERDVKGDIIAGAGIGFMYIVVCNFLSRKHWNYQAHFRKTNLPIEHMISAVVFGYANERIGQFGQDFNNFMYKRHQYRYLQFQEQEAKIARHQGMLRKLDDLDMNGFKIPQ